MDNKMASFGGRREFQRKSHWKFFLFLIFLTAFLALCLQRTAFFHSIRRCGRKIRIWPDGFPLKERQSTTP